MSTLTVDFKDVYQGDFAVPAAVHRKEQEKNIEVFPVKTESELYAKAREEAALRQEKIGKKIYEDAEDKIGNTTFAASTCVAGAATGVTVLAGVGVAALAGVSAPIWLPITAVGVAIASGAGALFSLFKTKKASDEKAAALSFRRDAHTTTKDADKLEYAEKTWAESFVRSKWGWGDNSNKNISDELVSETAKKLFDNDGILTQFSLLEPDADTRNSSYVKLVETIVNSQKYDNIPDKKGEIKGLQ